MATAPHDSKLHRDLRRLAQFIRIYCDGCHSADPRKPVTLRFCDVEAFVGQPIALCPACTKLLAHAFFKRTNCPLDPKPMCKHCPQHCYQATFRQQIREVMRYAGWKMVRTGRLDLILHMLF